MTSAAGSRGPGVRIPPPLFFVAGLLVAWWLDSRLTFEIARSGAGAAQITLGVAAVVVGVGVAAWGVVTYVRARTAIVPIRPARQLVVTGPYRLTRNPMYVGFTSVYVGVALWLNAAWPLVLLPGVLGSLYVLVIRREEQYLSIEFGDAYEAYCRRVRRFV
jgi:protein-S-isoprenylcysteine O-methyltransferase Ste14